MHARSFLSLSLVALFALAGCGGDDASTPPQSGSYDAGDDRGVEGGADGGTDAATPAIGTVEAFATLPGSSEGLAFGPGPDGVTVLYVGSKGSIVRVSPDGAVVTHAAVPAPVGVALAADGDLLVCGDAPGDAGANATVIWRVKRDGSASVLVDHGATPFVQTNFVAVAPDGSLLFSDSGANKVYRADADGSRLALVTDAISFPNGITFSNDGATAYVASWDAKKVWSLARASDGSYGAPVLFSDDVAYVDGLATFAGGDLAYVTSGDGVVRVGADKKKTPIVPASAFGKLPANGAFGTGAYGEGWLYVTSLANATLFRVWVGEGGTPLPVAPAP